MTKINRRTFARASAAIGAATVIGQESIGQESTTAAQAPGANDRIRFGVIGVGNRARQLIDGLMVQQDAEIVAICDVFKPHLEKAAKKIGKPVEQYGDFRQVLERKDIDAVVIATPDHWHAIQTIQACQAGKDVYVEKPLSHTILEGRKMVETARRTKRIVQVGTHRRSAAIWKEGAKVVQGGDLGHVTVSRAARLSNMAPKGIGKLLPSPPPEGLDWDMWLGPRAEQSYQDNIAPYMFRWWQNYSSQMGNWGVHYFDAIRWFMGEEAPTSVCTMGGQFTVEDDRTIPDTAEVIFQFGSRHLSLFSTFEASGNPMLPPGEEIEFRGTQGTLYVGGNRLRILPERGGQFQDHAPRMEPVEQEIAEPHNAQTAAHIRNFMDCIKSRELPLADIEIGHRSTTMALLANISLATQSRLEWDAKSERITNNSAANELLHYEYRSPWKL